MHRYLAVVLNGTKNAYYTAVGQDIVDAILKKRSEKGTPAEYWAQEEQVEKLEAVYTKWLRKGGVWSAAAPKVRAYLCLYQAINTNLQTTSVGTIRFMPSRCGMQGGVALRVQDKTSRQTAVASKDPTKDGTV